MGTTKVASDECVIMRNHLNITETKERQTELGTFEFETIEEKVRRVEIVQRKKNLSHIYILYEHYIHHGT